MARIRTIKPTFFRSEDVSALPLRARLTWIGLWTQCDDAGRTKDHARLIKADIWPLDSVSLAEIEEDLATLAAQGRIVRYEVDGKRYLEIANWSEHQKIDRPSKSTIPAPQNGSRRTVDEGSRGLDEGSLQEGKGKEGKGREANREAHTNPQPANNPGPEPPSKCPEHQNLTKPPPCGKCADQRKRHDQWVAERNARIDAAPRCRTHPNELAHNCRACASERKAGGVR